MKKKTKLTIKDTGDFFCSLKGKKIYTAQNKSGGQVIIGITKKIK